MKGSSLMNIYVCGTTGMGETMIKNGGMTKAKNGKHSRSRKVDR